MSIRDKLDKIANTKTMIKRSINRLRPTKLFESEVFHSYSDAVDNAKPYNGLHTEADWYDIESIFENHQYISKKAIYLLTDSSNTITITNADLGNAGAWYVTSDGASYSAGDNYLHTWNRLLDKPCSLGYKTRWIMVFSNDPSIASAVHKIDCLYAYIGNNSFINRLCLRAVEGGVTYTNNIIRIVRCVGNTTMSYSAPANNNAFVGAKCLEYIELPPVPDVPDNGAVSLDFRNANNISYLKLPENTKYAAKLTAVLSAEFSNNYSLAEFDFPPGIIYYGFTMPANMFSLKLGYIGLKTSIANIQFFSQMASMQSIVVAGRVGNPYVAGLMPYNYSVIAMRLPEVTTNKGQDGFVVVSGTPNLLSPSADVVTGTSAFGLGDANNHRLSKESMIECIDRLADLQWLKDNGKVAATSVPTCIFQVGSVVNLNKLSANDIAVATAKGWTVIGY